MLYFHWKGVKTPMKRLISVLLCMTFLFGTIPTLANSDVYIFSDLDEVKYSLVYDVFSNNYFKSAYKIVLGDGDDLYKGEVVACTVASALKKCMPDFNFTLDTMKYPAMVGYNVTSDNYVIVLLDSGEKFYWTLVYIVPEYKLCLYKNFKIEENKAETVMKSMCDEYFMFTKKDIADMYYLWYEDDT